MSAQSKTQPLSLIFICLIILVLIGCTSLPIPVASTPGALEETSSVIHFPEVESVQWVKTVSRLCIIVDQAYPALPPSYQQPIGEELLNIFQRIGVDASLGEGPDCQATLAIELEINPVSETVAGAGTCYLDAEATGKATLSAAGQTPLEMPLRVVPPKRSGITVVSECPKTPADAPIGSTWAMAVGGMLNEWWGSPALVSMLESEQPFIRWRGVRELQQMGTAAADAMPVLIEMLGDDQPATRAAAAQALGELRDTASIAVPLLIKAIEDSDTNTRISAIRALGQVGGDQALQALIQTLHHSDWYFRYEAANALFIMGPEAAPAVPELMAAIEDENSQVGWTAIDALGAIGPLAKECIPRLIEVLDSEDHALQSSAWRALRDITGQDFEQDAAAWQAWWETQP